MESQNGFGFPCGFPENVTNKGYHSKQKNNNIPIWFLQASFQIHPCLRLCSKGITEKPIILKASQEYPVWGRSKRRARGKQTQHVGGPPRIDALSSVLARNMFSPFPLLAPPLQTKRTRKEKTRPKPAAFFHPNKQKMETWPKTASFFFGPGDPGAHRPVPGRRSGGESAAAAQPRQHPGAAGGLAGGRGASATRVFFLFSFCFFLVAGGSN